MWVRRVLARPCVTKRLQEGETEDRVCLQRDTLLIFGAETFFARPINVRGGGSEQMCESAPPAEG